MNILVTNDDGPDAYGVTLLQQSLRRQYPDASIITLTPKVPAGGQALSLCCRDLVDIPVRRVDRDWYVCDTRPADLVYLGLDHPQRFLSTGSFDMLFAGVNHGANVGMDVFHSGTVAMAMLASLYFQIPAVAFSQEFPESLGPDTWNNLDCFEAAKHYLQAVLRVIPPTRDACINVNFPAGKPRGWKYCPVSSQSRFRSVGRVQQRRGERDDMTCLRKSFITLSPLSLRVNI